MTDEMINQGGQRIDILYGAKQIAEFLFGSSERIYVRKVYYLVESKQLPVFRYGRARLCARRATIRDRIERQEAGSISVAA